MNEKNKTLIILSPGFPENEKDTTCLPAQQSFVRSLNKHFPRLKIIVLAFEYPFKKSTYHWNANEVISFSGRNKGHFFRLRLWQMVWRKLKMIDKEENIIGLLSLWCTETALIGKWFAKKNKLRHYCWILGQDARKGNKMIKYIRPDSHQLIALSDSLSIEFFLNYKIHPEHIIPNGIDTSLFFQNITEKDIDVCASGSLIFLKRYDIFIEVIKEMTRNFPTLKVILCGGGEEEDNLNTLIKKSNLENNITLTGEISHAEVMKIMQRSKLFLHTSSYEGFSSACLEALCAGGHVISFCEPMKRKINHWHIVETKKEMIGKAVQLLNNNETEFTSVAPFLIDDTAKAMMNLFL